ncbi:MAG: TolC family protein [Pseudomonas sp.]|nr:TolC family protein [Pseudomonas sp.]
MLSCRTYRQKKLLWLKLSCLVCSGIYLNSAQGITLLGSVDAARYYDADISASRSNRDASGEQKWQGLAGLLPQVELSGNYSLQDQPDASYAAKVRRHAYDVTLNQPVFDLPKIAGYRKGVAISQEADVALNNADQQLILDVAQAFFNVLYQRDELAVSKAEVRLYTSRLAEQKAALKLGDTTQIELDEVQVNHDQAVARELAAENDLEVEGSLYQRLTGVDPALISSSLRDIMPIIQDKDKGQILSSAMHDNLDVKQAEYRLKQAEADVLGANGAHLPVLSIQASYGGNWSRGENENVFDSIFGTTSKTRSTMIAATLTFPLFTGGRQLSQSREAYSRRLEAQDLLLSARRKAKQAARTAYMGVYNGVAMVHAQKKAVESAQKRIRSTQYGKEIGLRSSADELTAIKEYYETVRAASDAQYKYIISNLQMAASTGSLNDAELSRWDTRVTY